MTGARGWRSYEPASYTGDLSSLDRMADLLPHVPKVLCDRYEIEHEIGRGGMATVYLAEDTKQERKVAVKILIPELSAALGAARFRREIQLTSKLHHPHILPIFDTGETEDSLFYVMPYVGGKSLRSRLAAERQLPLNLAISLTCEVASALDYAHRHGVIHRDIKPENILIEDGHAIVADFGIARAFTAAAGETLTQTGMSLGTPAYMSPEQALADRTIDGRSDVYALACVLYEMLAGQQPFMGPTAQAIIARHTLDAPPSVRTVRPAIPQRVETALFKAMAKAPADRFRTTAEFSAALCAPTEVMEPRRAGRRLLERLDRRQRVMLGALAAALVASAAFAAWRVWPKSAVAETGGVAPSASDPADSRLAVMYFDDVSPGRQLGYLADGLTNALIDRLDQVRTLDVVSRNGSSLFRGSGASTDSIARTLNIGTLVRGVVDSSGNQVTVRITVDDARSGTPFRSAVITQPVSELLAIPDSLAARVAPMLRELLGQQLVLRKRQQGTQSARAWSLLHRADRARREAEAQAAADDEEGSARGFAAADSMLRVSERLDPRWTEPIVSRGLIAYRRARLSQDRRAISDWIDAGLRHVGRALTISPRDADALDLRGTLRYFKYVRALEPNPRAAAVLVNNAEQDLLTSVNVDPTQASAWNTLSHLYYQKPDFGAAKNAAERAYGADAYLASAPDVLWRLYTTSYDLEMWNDASTNCAEGNRRFPANPRFVECEIWLLSTPARKPVAATAWRLVDSLGRMWPPDAREFSRRQAQIAVAAVLGRAGMKDSARSVLLSSRADEEIDPQGELRSLEAAVLTMLGDKDRAIDVLTVFLNQHPEHRAGLEKSPSWWWRPLKNDPRFTKLLVPDASRNEPLGAASRVLTPPRKAGSS